VRAALLLAALSCIGCNPRVDTATVGVYRAVLRLPGGDTPFGFEVAQEQQHYVLYVTNGVTPATDNADVDGTLGGDLQQR